MAPEALRSVAEKAFEASTRAELAANIAKVTAESTVTEMRERLDRQDKASDEFRNWLRGEWAEFKKSNDAFKTDFDLMDQRCRSHDDDLYGNPSKGKPGFMPVTLRVQERHDNWWKKLFWTIGLTTSAATGLIGWLIFFHGDDMKRGIFNPSEEERRLTIDRRVRQWYQANGVAEPHWPPVTPKPN